MKSLGITVLLGALLAGCAAPDHLLHEGACGRLGYVEGFLAIPQNQLVVDVTPSNGGSGGVLGVLIAEAFDNYRRREAAALARPISGALEDYDFRQSMSRELNDRLARNREVAIVLPLQLRTVSSALERQHDYAASTADAVLFVDVDYRLRDGELRVTALVELFPKSARLLAWRHSPDDSQPLAPGNSLLRQHLEFRRQAVSARDIRPALEEAAASLARQIDMALRVGSPQTAGSAAASKAAP